MFAILDAWAGAYVFTFDTGTRATVVFSDRLDALHYLETCQCADDQLSNGRPRFTVERVTPSDIEWGAVA